MVERTLVTDADIVREHRFRHVAGSPVDAITNPALRICLVVCAELRKKRPEPTPSEPDLKRLAAGDSD